MHCCKDEELSSKGYKCLVNQFGQLGFYQVRYWKVIPTTRFIQISKAGSEKQMTFDAFKSKVNNYKKEDEFYPNNESKDHSLGLFSPYFEISPLMIWVNKNITYQFMIQLGGVYVGAAIYPLKFTRECLKFMTYL